MTPSSPSGMLPQSPKVKGFQSIQTPNFNPQQMQLFQQLLGNIGGGAGQGLNYLSGLAGGDEQSFEQMEQPYYDAFSKLQGQTATRFSNLGARDSNAHDLAQQGHETDFASLLGSQRHSIQQNAIERLLNQSNSLLNQRPYETSYLQKPKKNNFMDLLGQGLPLILKSLLGQIGG